MGKAKTAGIIAGAIVAIFLIGIVAYAELFYDDARMARLDSWYYDDEDRLSIAVILTNQDGGYAKANGHLDLTIKKGSLTVYSNGYDFTKNDFLTWQPLLGVDKVTGYPIDIRKYFSKGDYDIYIDIETKGERYWQDLHDSFFSLEGF